VIFLPLLAAGLVGLVLLLALVQMLYFRELTAYFHAFFFLINLYYTKANSGLNRPQLKQYMPISSILFARGGQVGFIFRVVPAEGEN